MSMKTFYPVRREHNETLDAAVIGANIEGLLCALSLSQLDAVNVKVRHFRGLSGEMSALALFTATDDAACLVDCTLTTYSREFTHRPRFEGVCP